MKANRRLRPQLVLTAATLAMLAASCSDTRVIPPPTPTPTPRPAPPPPAPPPITRDWREAPITPGDWGWAMEGGQSVARFSGGALVLRCYRAGSTVTLLRAGAANRPLPVTITTTAGAHTLTATPVGGANPALAITLPARSPVLDAMIFSRGRFALEVQGLSPLYVPSWPEVSRVAEDCRS